MKKNIYIWKRNRKNFKANLENYVKYDEECSKGKGVKYIVKDYGFKDHILDLKKLIPEKETIKISGKDKNNFVLILYLFQNGERLYIVIYL